MRNTLFVTSYTQICESFQLKFGLKSPKSGVFVGQGKNKYIHVLLVSNDKVKSAMILSEYLSENKKDVDKIVVINPVNCPDPNISMGTIVIGNQTTEWDRSIKESSLIFLQTLGEIETRHIEGQCISGDRECLNKTTPILQSKMVDTVTYPVAITANYYNKQVSSIGIVADWCTQKFPVNVLSNIREFSSRLVGFIETNLTTILG